MDLRIITADFPVIHINGASIDTKLYAHRTVAELDHPDGSVTWDKLNESVQAAINDKSLINNLTDGTAPNSLQTPNSQAISEGAVALGEGSIAGSRCFNITAFDDTNKRYTLDSVEGLAVGDVFSLKLKNNYDDKGSITAINGNVVTVDNYQKDETSEVKYFRVPEKPTCGTTDFGVNAFAEGEDCMAVSDNSHASGKGTKAKGRYAHATGKDTEAIGYASKADGRNVVVRGQQASGEGYKVEVNGDCGHGEGSEVKVDGYCGHGEGAKTSVKGACGHAENFGCQANGDYAHSEGEFSQANAKASHAENKSTVWSGGVYGHGEGEGTVVTTRAQHVQGKYNTIDHEGRYAHIVGGGTGDSEWMRENIHTLDWNGNAYYGGKLHAYGMIYSNKDVIGWGNKRQHHLSEKLDTSEFDAAMSDVSNAIKGQASGRPIDITDISPITHDVKVSIPLKNALSYPYTDSSGTAGGVTFTVNNNGEVTVNGTANSYNVCFNIAVGTKLAELAYLLTGAPKGGSSSTYDMHLSLYKNNNLVKAYYDIGEGIAVNNLNKVDYDSYKLMICITKGTTVKNLLFSPKLSISPTEAALTVKDENNEVQATYTPNADGTVSGVKSVYPVMKLSLSDTSADMTVEYNKDINRALSDKADPEDIANIAYSVDNLNTKKADKRLAFDGIINIELYDGQTPEWNNYEQLHIYTPGVYLVRSRRFGSDRGCVAILLVNVDPENIIEQVLISPCNPNGLYRYMLYYDYVWTDFTEARNEFILKSSTTGSNKKFKITVDDSGALTAKEIK